MSDSGNFTSRILNKLFSKKSNKEPLVSGKLERSDRYEENYSGWVESQVGNILSELQQAYNKSNARGLYNPAFHVYNSDQSNGFFFNYHMEFESEEFSYLLDYFKETVVDLGYTVYTSDTKYKDLESGVQKIDRHYLKPTQEGSEMPMNQKYGNVLIELFILNDEVQYLKLMANIYSDRNFTEPKPFSEFLEKLLSL